MTIKRFENITADGRNLAKEEWRVIPEFPKYEITSDGDVRNRETWHVLSEIQNKGTGAYFYCLWTEDGKTCSRNFQNLVYAAYPELRPPPKVKPVSTKKYEKNIWRTIPDFQKYQMHPDGRVRNRSNQVVLKLREEPYKRSGLMGYLIRGAAGKPQEFVTVDELMARTFPEAVAA
jgi:hypothetical protein